ncbi:MAG: YpdA family putative bacillithiol disulfide reductase [Ferruginibacter sp.]|nr:YpdA family putative bacillithiol disulfide reductase [Cytophagales bacterium]
MSPATDILIIGSGPCGLACAIEATRHGLSHVILEKGSLCESIRRYPTSIKFFSTAENLEIGGLPFTIAGVKPSREEALQYYRKVAKFYQLDFRLFTEVVGVTREDDRFAVRTAQGAVFHARHVINATGYFDVPRCLGIPGENLPHVSKYYDEAFRYVHSRVVIVGAGNSAVEAALDLYRHDADVTIVHRGPELKPTAKYWLLPDIRNRIKEGKIKTCFGTEVRTIEPGRATLENILTGEAFTIPADFVFLLVGYTPDARLFAQSGVQFEESTLIPAYNPDTFETNVPGSYLCGTVVAGIRTEKVFIENGRDHARLIIRHIRGLAPEETEAEIDANVDVEEN